MLFNIRVRYVSSSYFDSELDSRPYLQPKLPNTKGRLNTKIFVLYSCANIVDAKVAV